MARTDIHRPSTLTTEDYELAYCYDSNPEGGDRASAVHLLRIQLEQGFRFASIHPSGQCDHCGAPLRYIAVLRHLPSRQLIEVGETCLENRFSRATREFHALRKQARLNREELTRREKLAAWLSDDPDHRAAYDFLVDQVEEKGNHGFKGFYFDLLHKANRNGELSERQVAAALRGKDRDEAFAAKRAAEAAATTNVIEGRIEVTGEVIKVAFKENDFGGKTVMTVKDDRGFKVWGTVPRNLLPSRFYDEHGMYQETKGIEKGDRVCFTATVTTSDRDSTFGFFSRPSKARAL